MKLPQGTFYKYSFHLADKDAKILAEISRDLGEAMVGIEISTLSDHERMQERGW